MKTRNRGLFLVLCVMVLSSCDLKKSSEYIGNVSYVQEILNEDTVGEGTMGPELIWLDSEGHAISFKELTKDKVVLVNLWAPWCTFCKMTFSSLRQINEEFKDQGVAVIGMITMDRTDPSYQLNYLYRFVQERDMQFPHIIETEEMDLWAAFGMERGGVPTTVLIDKNGYIVKAFSGNRNRDQFAEEIQRLL